MAFVFVVIVLAFIAAAGLSAYAFYHRAHPLAENAAKLTAAIAAVGVLALLVTVLAPSSNTSAAITQQTTDVNALPTTGTGTTAACTGDLLQVASSASTSTYVQVSFEILNGSSDTACTLNGAPKVTVHTRNAAASSMDTARAEPVTLQPGDKTTFKLTFDHAQPYTAATDCSIVTTYTLAFANGTTVDTDADASAQFCPAGSAPTAGDLSPPQQTISN